MLQKDAFNKTFISLLRKISNIDPLIPCYHVVSNERLPHIINLFKYKNIDQFVKDIDYFASTFYPISLRELIDYKKNRAKIKKNSIILTFDDGYKECYTIISEILYRKGLPGIFFICPDLIDNKNLSFRNKASIIIEDINKYPDKITFIKKFIKQELISSNEDVRSFLLNIKYHERYLLDHIAKKIDIDFDEYLKRYQPYLNVDQINLLLKLGFYIGSHGNDHARYQELSLEEQISDMIISLNYIRNTFKIDYNIFSFPFSDKEIRSEVMQFISDNLDLSFGSTGLFGRETTNHLQRYFFESGGSPAICLHRKYLIKNIIKNISEVLG